MKALVCAFNQDIALVGAFSVIAQLHRLIVCSTTCVPGSEELAAVPEGEDDEEEQRGDRGDQQEGPEQPPVHRLRQHPPLSPDLIVLTLEIR